MGTYRTKAYWRKSERYAIAAGLLVTALYFVVEWLLPRTNALLVVAEALVAIGGIATVARLFMASWKDVDVVVTADSVVVRTEAGVLWQTPFAGLSANLRGMDDASRHVLTLTGPPGELVLIGADSHPFAVDLQASGVPVAWPKYWVG